MFGKILNYAGENKKYIYLAVGLIFLAVFCKVIPYFCMYTLIEPLIKGEGLEMNYVLVRIVIIAVSLLANAFLYSLGLKLSHKGAYQTLENVRRWVREKIEKMAMGEIENIGAGTMRKLFTDDIEAMEVPLAHAIPEGIGNMAAPLIIYVGMFIIDWKLALLSLVTIPIGLIFMGFMYKGSMSKMENYYSASKKMNSTIIEYVNGMEVIKIFNKDNESYRKYTEDIDNYRDFTIAWYRESWPWMALSGAVLPCAALLTLPVGSYLVYRGICDVSEFILVLCLTFAVGTPMMKAMAFGEVVPQLNYKVEKLEEILNGKELTTGSESFKGHDYTIRYENVSFGYNEKFVLENVNFKVPEKTKTAIVGESGSGKSTLAKLLVHFYDINKGRIMIGGNDISKLSLSELSEQISFVSQEQFLFNVSLRENIRMGKKNATDSEVLEAARRARCMEFIEKLPNGLDSLAGDSGKMLSGGERQRISIARAILKNAPIIILDEATAFVDPENEAKMNEAIAEVVRDKTVIVIAHRIRSVMNSDQIVVLKDKEINALGTHEELIKTCDEYIRLWNISENAGAWKIGGKEDA